MKGCDSGCKLIWGAVVITFFWFCGMWWLLEQSKICDPNDGSFLSKYVSCRQANEIGDFFAGALASLAFLWLVVTVLLQTFELRAQRKELKLTRREFELQREVMEKQSNLLGEQVKIYQANEANKIFDEAKKKLALRVRGNSNFLNLTINGQSNGFLDYSSGSPDSDDELISSLAARVDEVVSARELRTGRVKLSIDNLAEFDRVYSIVDELLTLEEDLDKLVRMKVEKLDLQQLKADLNVIKGCAA